MPSPNNFEAELGGEAAGMKPAEKDSWSPTSLLIRLMVAGTVLAIWFWTQSLLGARTAPETGVADALHNLTAAWCAK